MIMMKIVEKYLLVIAMITGILFHKYIAYLSPATPFLLAFMLFVTYTNIKLKEIQFNKLHFILLAVQYIGSAVIYLLLRPFNEILAQATMMCVLAPTATSAPVIVGLLGGNIASTTAFTLLSNLILAFFAPLYLTVIENSDTSLPFLISFFYFLKRVIPILIFPFLIALLVQRATPGLHRKIKSMKKISLYVWAIALTIVLANVTNFVMTKQHTGYMVEIIIAISSLLICLLQFILGRKIGSKFNQTITGGQGMGQKNTILAIWLTQTYLNPIASIGPGLYVLWQNIINSYQIWVKSKTN